MKLQKIPSITLQAWEYGKSEPPNWALLAMVNYLIRDVFFSDQIITIPNEILNYRIYLRQVTKVWHEK